jgi:hypothetical protein
MHALQLRSLGTVTPTAHISVVRRTSLATSSSFSSFQRPSDLLVQPLAIHPVRSVPAARLELGPSPGHGSKRPPTSTNVRSETPTPFVPPVSFILENQSQIPQILFCSSSCQHRTAHHCSATLRPLDPSPSSGQSIASTQRSPPHFIA